MLEQRLFVTTDTTGRAQNYDIFQVKDILIM